MLTMDVLGADMQAQPEAPTAGTAESAERFRALNSLPAKAHDILYTTNTAAPPPPPPPPPSKAGWPMWAKVGIGFAGLAVVIAIVK